MSPGPRGQGPPERHPDPGVARGAGRIRDGCAELRGSLAHGPTQRGVQGALRFPVCHLRPDERQGEHITAAVRALSERARGGEGARYRGGEEDMSPASSRSRAH